MTDQTPTDPGPIGPGSSPVPVRYLSRKQFAERIGIKPDSLARYTIPPPDALIGDVRGWLVSTVDAWNASRPSRVGRGTGHQVMPLLSRETDL